MKKSKKTGESKIRYMKCSVCTTKTEQEKLFVVLHIVGLEGVKMCGACGKKKIDEWNAIVKGELA